MKKIILTFIATLLAGFSTAWAQNVASVNGTQYPTLAEALNAAREAAAGGWNTTSVTVEILDDITFASDAEWTPIVYNQLNPITINGNGKTITNLPGMLYAKSGSGVSTLTINNLTFESPKAESTEQSSAVIMGYADSVEGLEFNNVKINNATVSGSKWVGAFVGFAAGYSNVNDGPLYQHITFNNCSVTNSTIKNSSNSNGASVGALMGHANGSTDAKIIVNDVTVSGNTITTNETESIKAGALFGTVGALGPVNKSDAGLYVNATVSDNTVISNGTTITTIYGRQGSSTGRLTLTDGGSYDSAPIAESDAEWATVADGVELTQNSDGSYTVVEPVVKLNDGTTEQSFGNLSEAIAAVTDTDTLTLIKDATLEENVTSTLSSGESFTLNFNGKKITGGKIALNSGVMVSTDVDFGNGEVSSTTIETRIFSVADEGVVVRMNVDGKNAYKVVTPVDEVAYIDINENGEETASTATNVIDLAQLSGIVAVDTDQFYYASEDTIIGGLIFLANKTGKLILADDVTLTMNSAVGNNNVKGNLEVYGQEGQTGNLVCNGKSDVAVNMLSYTQKGGNVKSAENKSAAVNAKTIVVNAGTLDVATNSGSYPALGRDNSEATVTINGGVVTAKGTGTYNTGIKAGDIIITGGQVTAEGGVGMYATNVSTTTLSLKELDDFILSDSYDGTVKIAAGVTLYDRDDNYTAYSGTLTNEQKEAIKEHTLVLASILRIDTDTTTVVDLYDTLDDAIVAVKNKQFIYLTANVTLTDDIDVPLTAGEEFSLKFGTADIDGNGKHIVIPAEVSVNTDKQTNIFAVPEDLRLTHAIKETQNEDGTYTYTYTTVEAVAYNQQTNIRYATLQGAIDDAASGQTIVLMPAIEKPENTLTKTVTINKNITIEGGDYLVTSVDTTGTLYGPRLDPAFRITGRGSVTLNKVNLVAPYVVPGHDGPGTYDQYTSGSVGILVDKNFNDSLVINYSTITTTGRGIDIQSVGGGFVLNMMHSTITTTDDDPDTAYGEEADDFDPTKVYINSFDGDPYGRGRGINFGNDAITCYANIQFSKIQGYAYPIDIAENSGKLILNMTDGSTWGRDIINNWGDKSTINLKNVTSHSYNNETPQSDDEPQNNEAFAAIVDYKTADLNIYNIEDLKVVASVEADSEENTSASQNFIDLRGTNATVKITGKSGYVASDTDENLSKDIRDRVGFVDKNINGDNIIVGPANGYLRLIDATVNNRLYFDEASKSYFSYWFESMDPEYYDIDSDNAEEYIRVAINDTIDYTNLYPVVPLEVKVMLTITPEDDNLEDDIDPVAENYYYGKLEDAFNSEYFENGAEVIIMDNITMNKNITPDLKRGEEFTLTSLKREDGETSLYSITPAGFHIYLDPLVIANYDYDENPGDIFAASNEEITTILMRKTTDLVGIYQPTYDTEGHINGYEKVGNKNVDRYVYTAANVYWAMDIDDVADYGQYWLFDELFTNDPEAPCAIWPNTYNRLEMDLKLERNLKFPTGDIFDGGFEEYDPNDPGTDEPIDEPDDEVTPQQFWIDFNVTDENPLGYIIEKGDYSIILQVGQEVYTTTTTDIFTSGDPEYTVVYDTVKVEKTLENGEDTVTFSYKYYLMKDGLAVTVDPATFCGDRLTPNFVVKKKVEEVDPNNATQTITKWVELTKSLTKEEYDEKIANDEDVSGYDFFWHLVPPVDENDDSTYVSAKTYVQALVIEGISFQGIRKADFTILPRDIKDVDFSGNVQPWTSDGYKLDQIADSIVLVYNCLAHGTDTTLTRYDETTQKGDYMITVADSPAADSTYIDIDTYSKVITITAVEGGNYTGTLKLDFTILPDSLIDIAKCMVVSDATYTSAPLSPETEGRIQVIWKNPETGEDMIVDPSAYTVEANAADSSYIDAKTYSNALTIVANPDSVVIVDGNEYRFFGTLIADYVIKPRDLADSLAVKEDNDNEGMVILEAYAGAGQPKTDPKTIFLTWTGNALVPIINSTDTTKNNINLILTAKEDSVENETPGDVEYKLEAYDYSYTIEPSPMVDPGWYKVIFTGRGNFCGMREVKVLVLKDIKELAKSIKMPYQIIPDNLALTPSQMKGIEVKDGNKVLIENENYTLVIQGGKPNEFFDEDHPIYVKGKYYAHFYGKEPYYTGQYVDDFRAFFEYIGWDTNPVAGTGTNIYKNPISKIIRGGNGNTIAHSGLKYDSTNTTPVSVRITDVSDSLNLKAEITYIDNINDETVTACDPTKEIIKVKPTFQIEAGKDNDTVRIFTFNIVGVQDNAFKDLPIIHCLDLTQIEGYTPDNLTRSEDGPFNYYPVQSLVYLDGCSDVTGTNYIYKKGENDFRCEELKIYDDIKGDQQGFETDADYIGGGHAWEFRNIYQFVADKVTNTRVFLAGQHYTTCLPYKLQMNSALKAYTLDAASDNIFGFKQYTAKELDQFTPYVLIPSKGGNLLNNDESTVCYVTPTSNRGFLPLDEGGNRRYDFATPTGHIMYGSNIYMGSSSTYPTVEGLYIMQSKNQWKRIPAGKTYNNACVLPMRGYIMLPNHPQISGANPSRESSDGPEYISAKYMDVDGVAEISIDANDDWTNAEVYDLQGRKVDTTARLPKGVYIVNGQKRIRK